MQGSPVPTPVVARTAFASARANVARPTLYVVIVLFSVLCAFAYKLRTDSIFACPATGYGSDQYLAYCQTGGYGDYDHGAFWFDLEPAAQRAAADAQVLFVGNSRMQFALSTRATERWFASSPALHYLMGFSFGENALFVSPLLARVKPRASVYVINVDRFFDDAMTAPAEAIQRRSSETQQSYDEKKRWQIFHKGICGSIPSICGDQVAFFRSRSTGAWQFKGTENFHAAPVSDDVPDADDRDHWKRYAAMGEDFVSHLPVDRRCVILTVAPWQATKAAEARAIATALKIDLVMPELDGLRTFDGDHLDQSSAERWSAAFFEGAGPRIRQCLHDAHAPGR